MYSAAFPSCRKLIVARMTRQKKNSFSFIFCMIQLKIKWKRLCVFASSNYELSRTVKSSHSRMKSSTPSVTIPRPLSQIVNWFFFHGDELNRKSIERGVAPGLLLLIEKKYVKFSRFQWVFVALFSLLQISHSLDNFNNDDECVCTRNFPIIILLCGGSVIVIKIETLEASVFREIEPISFDPINWFSA